jgi:uncharacterized protein (TIGR00251 family)
MPDDALISVRVTPRSSKDQLLGWQDGVLRVKLRAPPVDGRANEALCRYLASLLGVAASDVEVVSGTTARAKRLRVRGLSLEAVMIALGGGR